MTVVTVFGQPTPQLLDLFLQLLDLLFERQQFGYLGFEHGIFFSQCLQFFFLRHSLTLPSFSWFGKSLAVLASHHSWGIYTIDSFISTRFDFKEEQGCFVLLGFTGK